MATGESIIAYTAVSVGTSPLMARSVLIQWLSTGSMSFTIITAEQTPTYTSTVRSGATVRGLVKGSCALDWKLEIVQVTRPALTRILGTTPYHES